MTVESATYISDFVPGNTHGGSDAGEGDDHLALIKDVLQSTFPGISGAVTATHAELNYLDLTTLGTAQASKAITVSAGGAVNASSVTWSNLGTVTTVDINGGTADAVVIGGSSAAAGSFTTLAASGAQTLTGATTLGTSLTLPAGATVTELSTDGTLAGNSDAAIPTEKAVKTYVDALDFATEAYVDARSFVQVCVPLNVGASAGTFAPIPIGVTGTITRIDCGCWIPSTDSTTVTVKTAANGSIYSNAFSATTFAVDTDTSPGNASVTAGDVLKLEATATSIYDGVITATLTIDIS